MKGLTRSSTQKVFIMIVMLVRVSITTHNNITVIDPKENTTWYHGSNSYCIAWTQTNHAFQWDIEMFSAKSFEKVVDIRQSLREYKDTEMSFYWLISSDVSSGMYFIRVKESNMGDMYGDSRPFLIRSQDELPNILSSSGSFSPHSDHVLTTLNLLNTT
ncbi:hypothetical protein QZH41_016622 [Actinostola sp. cb2023]|nr:hypothetical protein QZH41_016622 [Actinostola sp. cb2023]